MSDVDAGLAAQIKNIETHYRKPMSGWLQIITASGFTTHAEIMKMLEQRYGMVPGAANRVSMIARGVPGAAAEPHARRV
jgi:hypothetical protein